jgi:8-oxo-dGTP pyrophosphatase MutT (NUDIX family)
MSNLAERLRAALASPPTSPLIDRDDLTLDAEPIPAAVLVPITDRPEPGIILTVRREDMRTHAGQIALPGGRIDHGESAVEAALREAEEEIGLASAAAEIVGTVAPYRTGTGFLITPVVAVVEADLPLVPHEREVADLFEAPLAFLLDPANHQPRSALFQGRERHYYEIMWNDRRIWGATAGMLINLSRQLQWN